MRPHWSTRISQHLSNSKHRNICTLGTEKNLCQRDRRDDCEREALATVAITIIHPVEAEDLLRDPQPPPQPHRALREAPRRQLQPRRLRLPRRPRSPEPRAGPRRRRHLRPRRRPRPRPLRPLLLPRRQPRSPPPRRRLLPRGRLRLRLRPQPRLRRLLPPPLPRPAGPRPVGRVPPRARAPLPRSPRRRRRRPPLARQRGARPPWYRGPTGGLRRGRQRGREHRAPRREARLGRGLRPDQGGGAGVDPALPRGRGRHGVGEGAAVRVAGAPQVDMEVLPAPRVGLRPRGGQRVRAGLVVLGRRGLERLPGGHGGRRGPGLAAGPAEVLLPGAQEDGSASVPQGVSQWRPLLPCVPRISRGSATHSRRWRIRAETFPNK
ncbi:gibberellin receptor GID1L2 [Iris pallida]|uniref:Gibberellin receptor GID1L2 n=1 Tax=Iris pallida TaxID=29817 RepID=A0AAX6G7T8_IRIPA|nr:gibberellin receptor GID1L2 [Iris pallida]